ncbi:MAG: porin [Alphaproteobacteria bacterium]|nr:porin [Alphaproteobacteria bacterium]
MKKLLLGTSALVVAGLAAASAPASAQTQPFGSPNFAVTVGGYARQYVTYVGQDNLPATTRSHGFDQTSDNRLILTFRAAVPNGMSAGAVWQINPNAGNTGNSITRRMWSFLEGSFGQVQLGGADNVAAQGSVGAPEAFNGGFIVGDNNALGINVAKPTSAQSNQAGNPSTGMDIDGISNKIVYWTPRFEGFQAGVNYTPTMSYSQGLANTNNQYLDGWAGNINFTRTFGAIGVKAAAGYVTFAKPSGVGLTTATQNSLKDPSSWDAGLVVSVAGFDFGGSYQKTDNWRSIGAGTTWNTPAAVADGLTNFNGNSYDLGIAYTFGAAMVSVNYTASRNDGSTVTNGVVTQQTNGKDKIDIVGASGRYTLAPGVMANLGVFSAKYKEGNGHTTSFFGSADQSRANGVVSGLTLTF